MEVNAFRIFGSCSASGRRLAGIVVAALLSLVDAKGGHAAVIASGYLWSEDASQMVCFVLNVSSTPVKILSAKIVSSSGVTIDNSDTCTQLGTLQPGQRCGLVAPTVQAAGIVEIDAPKGRVRGTCQLNASGNVILESTEMR
jgi:hypothetical protein